jgi:hypothetical protein
VTMRMIAMMIFSAVLESPQTDCHMSSIDCAVRCTSPAMDGGRVRRNVGFVAETGRTGRVAVVGIANYVRFTRCRG